MKKILSKILDEINKEKPRLDYIRGLIEASIEDETISIPEGWTVTTPNIPFDKKNIHLVDNQNVDEEIIPDFVKPGPIGKINS
jgi:hypothetical protein